MHPLLKKAFHSHKLMYGWWVPCKLQWTNDENPIRLKLETTWWKLIPWYFMTWIIVFGVTEGTLAFLLIREIFQPSPRLTPINIGMYAQTLIFTSTSWGVFIAFHGYWTKIVAGFNQLAILEEDWRLESSTVLSENPDNRPQCFGVRKYTSEELTGMFLIFGIVIIVPVACPTLVIFSVGTNLDPFLPILEDYFLPPVSERSALTNFFVLAARMVPCFCCAIEVSRFFFIVLLLTSSLGHTMERLLTIILETDHYSEAYQKYQLMWLQYYIIKRTFNNVLAIGTVIGFFGGTIIIWLSFNSWSYVTPFIAAFFPILAICLLLVLLVGISTQVSIVEKSNQFIYKWKKESLRQTGIHTRKDIQHCKLIVRTLRCLPVACSSCYGINSNTPFSFLQILMKAVTDSLLGIQM